MKKHKIEISDLKDLVIERQLAVSYGLNESKKLTVIVNILNKKFVYRIFNNGEMIKSLYDLNEAIECYNSI